MNPSPIVADTEERAALRDAVGKLVGRYGHDYFMARAAAHEEPTELWEDLGSAGFLGVHLSEAYGGGGGTMSDLAVVVEEVSTQGCPLLMMVISPAICGSILDRHGSHELKQQWLPGIADGTLKVAFAITEPDAGSNSHEITTTARPDGDGWRNLGHQVLDVGHRRSGRGPRRRPRAGGGPVGTASPLPVRGAHRLRRAELAAHPLCAPAARAPVHGVLRRRPGRTRVAHRRGRQRAAPGLRGTEPGAHHRRLHQQRHRPLRARQGLAVRP